MSEEAAAEAQDARHWKVDARLTPAATGAETVTVTLADANGHPITGADLKVHLAHPIDERRDVAFTMTETEAGTYRGTADAAGGQWFLDIIVSRGRHRLFRSQNRVIVE
jgi:nitrogen fixation protein FixH